MLTALNKDSEWSSLREEYIEYAFLGELCREYWRREAPVDILRAHTDQAGFDVVMESGELQRHVQIKSSFVGAATRSQKINAKLQSKIGGCVVWIFFDRANLGIRHYRWFGDPDPRARMPSLGNRAAKHTKANSLGWKAIRPGVRTLVWGDFTEVATTAALAKLLFPTATAAEET